MKKRRVVLKIGTNLLTTAEKKLDINNLRELVEQVAGEVQTQTVEFIIVTSGAITCGAQQLGMTAVSIPERQAAASVGQSLLMQEYSTFFRQFQINVGQILLTKEVFTDPILNQNAENTITTLLERNVIPIINENDSISTHEIGIHFGDNDQLSSLTARLVNADVLLILTNTDGLYTANPDVDPSAKLISKVTDSQAEIMNHIQDRPSSTSRGGMESKVKASFLAKEAGIQVIIANGRKSGIIPAALSGEGVGTQFIPGGTV